MANEVNHDVEVREANHVYKAHSKTETAEKMLDDALTLHFGGGSPFSVIHLARAAAEVLDGIMKHGQIADNMHGKCRPYDQNVTVFRLILEAHRTPLKVVLGADGNLRPGDRLEPVVVAAPTDEKVCDRFNRVRNAIKHHNEAEDLEFWTCASLETESALDLAIETYFRCRNSYTAAMLRYLDVGGGRKLVAPRLRRDA